MQLNLAEHLRASAEGSPDAPAIISGARRADYGSVYDECLRFAAALGELGIQRGEHVAMMIPNIPEFTISYFGCHAAGSPVVPLNVLLKSDEIAYHLRDSDAAALIVPAGLLEHALPAFEQVDSCRHLIVIGDAPDGTVSYSGAVSSAQPITDLAATDERDTAVILYTSGTTGAPKGAELSHSNLAGNAACVATQLTPIDSTSVCLLALPLFHSFGQTALQNTHVLAGGAMVLMPRFDPDEALRLMTEHQVSYFAGVPTMYFAMLQCEAAAGFDASRVRYCVSGGAPMPVEVMKAFNERFSVNILEGYGLSETSPVASFNTLDRPQKPGSVGYPIDGVEFRLAGTDGELITETDVPGEIQIKGCNVMKGYYGKPEATAEAIVDGWFRTGDVATVDEDGFYFIVDRIKDLIIRGGFNVYPREIEEVLYAHPAVTEAAVIGIPDDRLGEEVVAYIACGGEQTASPDEVIDHCKDRLAAYKYPRQVVILDALPVGPTGKILKRALRDL